ncbi:MAG: response regulator [Planctomycetota bacterium]
MIVDDERGIAHALTIRLRAAGYDVRCAFDGASGLAAAVEWRPDLILLDIRMPEMDGFEVKRRLMAHPELRATPVIFLSANVQESARQAAMAAGAHAFLTKPYESKEVLAAIRSAFGLSESTPMSRPARESA